MIPNFGFMPMAENYQTQLFHHGKKHNDTVEFNDEKMFNKCGHKIHQVTIFHDGKYVYGLRFHYIIFSTGQHVKGAKHLGKDHPHKMTKEKLKLANDEFITQIFGHCGEIMDAIGFKTTKGQIVFGGGQGGQKFDLHAPNGTHFGEIWGGLGGHLHNISGKSQPMPNMFQQEQFAIGKTHNDTVAFNDASIVQGTNGHHKISKITIYHDGKLVFGLQFDYSAAANGLLYVYQGTNHVGNQAHTLTKATLALEPNEYVIEAFGKCGDIMDHIGFKTSSGRTIEGGGHGGQAWDLKAPNGMHFNTLAGGMGGHIHNIKLTASTIPNYINWGSLQMGNINQGMNNMNIGSNQQQHHHHHH